MKNNLENTLLKKSSLVEELKESFLKYPTNVVNYFKSLGPASLAGLVGSALAQYTSDKLGYDGALASTISTYAGAYPAAYLTFFTIEYQKNKEKFKGVFSKEFGKFIGTFIAADIPSDLMVFSPSLIATNVYLENNYELPAAVQGAITWIVPSLAYILTMAAMHPAAQRITDGVIRGVKNIRNKVSQ